MSAVSIILNIVLLFVIMMNGKHTNELRTELEECKYDIIRGSEPTE
mgnify:CR=1 FL=1